MSTKTNREIIDQLKACGATVFSDLKPTKSQSTNVFGIMTTYSFGRAKRGTRDYYVSTGLIDPTTEPSSTKDITANLFHSEEGAFPRDARYGDIIVLRDVTKSASHQVISQRGRTQWCILDSSNLSPRSAPNMPMQLTEQERTIAQILGDWYRASKVDDDLNNTTTLTANDVRRPAKHRDNRQLRTTAELNDTTPYFNFVGQVVSYNPKPEQSRVELLLTDFTPNAHPMDGYEAEDTISPTLLIQCTIWDQHADECPTDLEKGEFLYIRNARRKISRLGYQEMVVSAGKANTKQYRKVNRVDGNSDPAVLDIKRRAEEYWQTQKRSSADRPQREIVMEDIYAVVDDDIPYTTISEVLDDQASCKQYTIRATVLDYKPSDPAEWIKKWCPCRSFEGPHITQCSQCKRPLSDQCTLVFDLLLQDQHGRRAILHCYGPDANSMFPNLKHISADEECVQQLKTNVSKIVSAVDDDDKMLYLDFGIQSYTTTDGRHFRVRNTKFMFD